MVIVYLDRQHCGKPSKPMDRGASVTPAPAFGMGREAMYTGYLSLLLEEKLLDLGATVFSVSDGEYRDRHRRVNDIASQFEGPQVYLSLHLNAGNGDYASFFHHHLSSNGKNLAEKIAARMESHQEKFPEIKRYLAKAANPDDWTRNAYYTIRGVSDPVAICCEPMFIDTHREYLTLPHLESIANSIAVGIFDWVI
jgi:N-acetylmuramoyl-L-alanine amidase